MASQALEENRATLTDMVAFKRTDAAFHPALAKIGNNPVFAALHGATSSGWRCSDRLPCARKGSPSGRRKAISKFTMRWRPTSPTRRGKRWIVICAKPRNTTRMERKQAHEPAAGRSRRVGMTCKSFDLDHAPGTPSSVHGRRTTGLQDLSVRGILGRNRPQRPTTRRKR